MKFQSSRSVGFVAVVITVLCIAASQANAQYKADAIKVARSTVVDQLKALRSANPKMTSAEFAAAANELLDKSGINFAMSFDSGTCDRIKKVKMEQKDPNAPLKIGATLKSIDAEGASLSLPEPRFPSSGDCNCYVELPLLQMTDADFITIISGRNIRFHMPANFSTFEALLLDSKDGKTIKRRWRIPFRGSPVGVSYDENVLYLAFPEPELNDLSFLVFGEGVFQIATRAEAEDGGKGKQVKISTSPAEDSRMQFDRWQKSLLVSYMSPCGFAP